jgi:hypothetical protein
MCVLQHEKDRLYNQVTSWEEEYILNVIPFSRMMIKIYYIGMSCMHVNASHRVCAYVCFIPSVALPKEKKKIKAVKSCKGNTLQEIISTKQSSSVEVTRRSMKGETSNFKSLSFGSSHLHIQ